jgi:hypothetical protein
MDTPILKAAIDGKIKDLKKFYLRGDSINSQSTCISMQEWIKI